MHRKALGRGLEALIPSAPGGVGMATEIEPATSARQTGSIDLRIESVAPNPHQPRTRFDEEAIRELSASIKVSGVLQPILVRRAADGYELVAGERRLRAARLAGLERIPAVIKDVSDHDMMEMALIENIQREDLNPIEEAKAYLQLSEVTGLTHDQISERVGKQRVSVTNTLRLLTLPPEVQDMVSRETLSAGHARALLGLESKGDMLASARYVQTKGFSVRRTEAYVRRKLRKTLARPGATRPHGLTEWENKLQQRFSTHVSIRRGRKGGKIEFEFYSDEDLERLFEIWGVL
jgi:ParB family transcriptional regulator, chromosome partitioning protein